jgi:ketosteroid isomerase-like protein
MDTSCLLLRLKIGGIREVLYDLCKLTAQTRHDFVEAVYSVVAAPLAAGCAAKNAATSSTAERSAHGSIVSPTSWPSSTCATVPRRRRTGPVLQEVALAEHPNVATFRTIYTAFNTGDMETLASFFDEDVVWHTPGRHILTGTYEGRAATFASFAEEFERSGGTYSVEVRDVLANDDHIVAFLHATADREGKRLDQEYAIVFAMRDGKIHAAWEVWKDQPSDDEF